VKTEELKQLIETGIAGASVKVQDLTGTGDHFQAEIVSDAFEGKLSVERHRMVYSALGKLVGGAVHALTLRTLTRAEHENETSRATVRLSTVK
jgi:stress-induced morphogen